MFSGERITERPFTFQAIHVLYAACVDYHEEDVADIIRRHLDSWRVFSDVL